METWQPTQEQQEKPSAQRAIRLLEELCKTYEDAKPGVDFARARVCIDTLYPQALAHAKDILEGKA